MYGELYFYVNEEKGTVTAVLEDYAEKVIHRYLDNYGKNSLLTNALFGIGVSADVSLSEKLGLLGLVEPIKATARCHEEDDFDFEIGKQVAIAKVRAKYYTKIHKMLNKVLDMMNKEIIYVLDQANEEVDMMNVAIDELHDYFE